MYDAWWRAHDAHEHGSHDREPFCDGGQLYGDRPLRALYALLYDDAQQLHGALLRDGGDRAWTCELNSSWVLNGYLEAALPPSLYLNLRSVCVRIREQM